MKNWTGVVAGVAIPVLLGMAASAEAAVYVHATTLPTDLVTLDKSTIPFAYLEIERQAEQGTRVLPTDDSGHTFWRTSDVSGTYGSWGAGDKTFNGTDQSQFCIKGGPTSNYTGVETQWNNKSLQGLNFVVGQTVSVYVFTALSSGTTRSATLGFKVGTDIAAAQASSVVGSATITGAATGQIGWYKIGEFTYQSDLDSFILTYDTVLSPAQADTILLVQMPVPEPAGAGLLSLGCATFLLQFRRR